MKIETPILKRLGPVPFWRGERKCLDQLEEIYRKAMSAAGGGGVARVAKKAAFACLALLAGATLRAEELWRHCGETDWRAGAKLDGKALGGKVVLVCGWSVDEEASRAALARMQEVWEAFRTKPFVLVASHRGGRAKGEAVRTVVAEKALTFPVYQDFDLASSLPLGSDYPRYWVVDHRAKVAYAGPSDRDATEALVTALGKVGRAPDLLAGVVLKRYRPLKNQLVFGKGISSAVKKLETDVKYLAKGKSPAQAEQRKEAEAILKAIEAAADEAEEEIASLKRYDGAKALKMMRAYRKTFPARGEKYDDDLARAAAARH